MFELVCLLCARGHVFVCMFTRVNPQSHGAAKFNQQDKQNSEQLLVFWMLVEYSARKGIIGVLLHNICQDLLVKDYFQINFLTKMCLLERNVMKDAREGKKKNRGRGLPKSGIYLMCGKSPITSGHERGVQTA